MIKKIFYERLYLGLPSINIIEAVEIAGNPSREDLKIAIYYAVNRFESLRSRIMYDNYGEAYYVMREQAVEPYIEFRTYHQEETEFVREQERKRFCLEDGDMIRFYVEPFGENVLLRVVSHHMAGDGRSIMRLIKEIMSNLKELSQGDFSFTHKETIPLDILTREYMESHLNVSDLLRCSINEINEKWKDSEKIFSVSEFQEMFDSYWENHFTSAKTIKIHKSVIERLHAACVKHGVSVNSAIITAILKEATVNHYVSVAVEARPKECNGIGNYSGSLLLDEVYNHEKTYWENVDYIHKLVHTQLADKFTGLLGCFVGALLDCNLQDALSFRANGTFKHPVVEEYRNMMGLNRESTKLAMLVSNLGAFDMKGKYGKYEVKSAQFYSPLSPGLNCNIGVVTINNTLTFNMLYCDKWGSAYADMLERVVGVLSSVAGKPNMEEQFSYIMDSDFNKLILHR